VHASGEVSLRRFQQEVAMIAHEAISMTQPLKALYGFCKHREKGFSIFLVEKDILFGVATANYMINGAFKFNSQWACHSQNIKL